MEETFSSVRQSVKHQHQSVQKELDALYDEKQKITREEEEQPS